MAGPTGKNYLKKCNIKTIEYKTPENLYADLQKGKLDAVVGDAPIVQYFVAHKGVGRFKLAGDVFKPEKYGVLFPAHSYMRERVNRAIIYLQETGEYKKILDKYFGSKNK